MKYKALSKSWSCDFGDGITHQWTVGVSYTINQREIKDVNGKIITYLFDVQSDYGISKDIPVEVINPDLMRDTFGIELPTIPE